jgi:acid phosphatase type 7
VTPLRPRRGCPPLFASIVALLILALAGACSSTTPTSPSSPGPGAGATPTATPQPTPDPDPAPTPDPIQTPTPVPTPPFPDEILVGAGDIALCGSEGAATTARMLDALPGTVFTAGDNVQVAGAPEEYANCFDPTWGRHKARVRPSPGNHDYNTASGVAYYSYFGTAAGPSGNGYYSYDLGAWHILSLNSNVPAQAGSPQEQWLRQDLAANTRPCVLAYWHHPLFNSVSRTGDQRMLDIWRALYAFHATAVINGHYHIYERFAPQTPVGQVDAHGGIREFIVGTGGMTLMGTIGNVRPNSEVRNNTTWGVLRLTLRATGYDWQFLGQKGVPFSDAGSAPCAGIQQQD